MPTPPTLVSYTEVTWNATGQPKTTASISWLAGDVIVVIAGSETADTLGVPTATGLTFTKQKDWPGTGGTTCSAFVATATPGAGGSATVSVTESGAHTWGFGVWVWRGSAGVGNSVEQHTATKTVALTPAGADGAIVWGLFDFAAAAVQTITPTPTNTRQRVALTPYTIYVSDLIDQVSAGSVSYGISGTGSGPFSIVALEIKAAASAAVVNPNLLAGNPGSSFSGNQVSH